MEYTSVDAIARAKIKTMISLFEENLYHDRNPRVRSTNIAAERP
jgi:hypothetical protein